MIMLLKAENIGMTYPKSDRVILKEQSLNIERNDLIVITGPSGRGKSTLLAIAGGILRPTSGHVYFEDKDLYSLSDKELSDIHRTKIGYVPQSNVMLKDYNILDNIVMPFVLGDKNTDVNALKQKALELMSKFKIEDREKRYPAGIYPPCDLVCGDSYPCFQRLAFHNAVRCPGIDPRGKSHRTHMQSHG